MRNPATPAAERRERLLRRWLVALDLGLFALAVGLGAWNTRGAILLGLLVPVALVPFSYARWRLHREIERALGPDRQTLASVFTGAGMALDAVMIAQLLTARSPEALSPVNGGAVSWLGPVWFSGHALLFLAYAGSGAARRVLAAGRRLLPVRRRFSAWRRPAVAVDRAAPDDVLMPGPIDGVTSPERRLLLQQAGLAAAGLPFFVSLSGVRTSYDFRVDEHEIELPGWPAELDGLRVVHLSDIHVGGGMNRARLLRVAELTNASRPDLVAHTGDFLTHRSGEFDEPLYEALARIRAPHGQWACFGNHDFDDAARLQRKLAAAGVTTLRDRTERVRLAGRDLEIAGADFVFSRGSRRETYARLVNAWAAASPDVPASTPRLLLNHDPTAFTELPARCADLVLSGHTHGGHVGVQLGASRAWTVVGLAGWPDQGVFRRDDDVRLFVTRCVGFYGYPMRLGIPPEIAVLVLRSPGRGSAPAPRTV